MRSIMQPESVGSRVPTTPFLATVHSVFESAANLRVEGLDYLLTLFVSEDTDLPQGIRLPRKAAAIIRNLEVGQKLQYRSGRLQWAGAEVDLQAAHRHDGAIPPTAKRLWSPETTSAWRTAWDLLAQRQDEKEAALRIRDVDAFLRDAHPGEPRRGDAAPILGELILGMQRLDSSAAAAAVRKLVGLGEGLTPTGDDVLVGLVAAAWARSETDHRRATWVQALAETVREQSHRTNDISRSYLTLAAEGQFSSSLVGLAVAICSGASPQMVGAAAEIACQTGHTSGLDAATGLLAGLAAWNDI